MNFRALALLALIGLLGCSSFSGNIRDDLNDDEARYSGQPTVGGAWPERSYMGGPEEDTNSYNEVGRVDRRPAGSDYEGGDSSWVTSEQEQANKRDAGREPLRYSQQASAPPSVKRQYKNGTRATKEDFIDRDQNEGSLWASNGQTNYLFTKNRIRSVGDIMQIDIEEALVRDVATELRKTLTEPEREQELVSAQDKLKSGAGKSKEGGAAAAPPPAPGTTADAKEEPEVRDATYADIDVATAMEFKAGDSMLAEVIQRFPNGNYMVQATKRIPYRGTIRTMNIVAIASAGDVDTKDSIKSSKLYEYRIKVFR